MMVEFFFTNGCGRCADERLALRRAAEALIPNLDWRDVDVVVELDHAVALGVLTLPALAIDGELVFSGLPSERRWRQELCRRTAVRP